jgi:hypothetical protein
VSSTDEVNGLFLDHTFSDAGMDGYSDDADTTDNATA